ncbi:MAG: radical SAM protein, partial [Cyanobacteria bacterium]|nr:radical SAM protein [Cyanobacteriota bacterium]
GIALHAAERGDDDTLVIAGGPGAQNPELLAPFVDLFVIGDGEPSLPRVSELWKELQGSGLSREEKLARIAASVDWAYVPRFYEPEYDDAGIQTGLIRTRDDVPAAIKPCVVHDYLAESPLPTRPIVPFVETAHERIAIEIMRGCPWQCRFCQSTVIKRPLRYRPVESIVSAALEAYRNTGYDEISLLSLSTSDYPEFERLVERMSEVFTPLGVKISLPSLRITEMLKKIPALLQEGRRSGLTLAPEVARDDMRSQIRKPINNEDLYEGCREAFKRGWRKVKLYFMCGLPGERAVDLDGIIDMAETIARIGKDVTGRYMEVTASVSNFVPKPHTPYQWNGMRDRAYFQWAHRYLRNRVKIRSVKVKCHDIET